MRRPRTLELMLLTTVVLWALNLTVTRYILTHGFEPLAYATVRYGAAGAIFVGIAVVAERSLRIRRTDLALVAAAVLCLWLNQLAFVYALEGTSASTIALILGATPIFAALIGLPLGLERALPRRFWIAAAISFAGVGLVALGSTAGLGGDVRGTLLGIATAATWAGYSVAIAPLMERYSASRISAVVLPLGWILIALVGWPQTLEQDYALGWEVWALLAFATLGPLVLTNVLWFRSLHRIGPSRATLVANLQPFVAAVFALVLLSERMTALQVLGGVLIAAGILFARRAHLRTRGGRVAVLLVTTEEGLRMDAVLWIVLAVVVLAAIALIAWIVDRKRRTSHLQDRFGSEYDRTVETLDDRREAEHELREREQRHDELDITPLTAASRSRYADEWERVQARFVDDPEGAVGDADRLVKRVMGERGYPTDDDFERRAADVSVDYPDVVENYREGHGLWHRYRSSDGDGETEDLRQAMVHFRRLFDELLEGEQVEGGVR